MMLQPLRGKILVQVLPGNNITESGIILSPKEEVPHRGRICSMGLPYRDKKQREFPWGLNIGHIVHFKRQWQTQRFEQIEYYILNRDQIFAVEYQSKAYAFSDYIIVKRLNEVGGDKIFIPAHFESQVEKETGLAEVLSVGRDDKLGVKVGDRLLIYRNEGLKVAISLIPELWSIKARAVLAKIVEKNVSEVF